MHPRCPQDRRMNQFWTPESQNRVNPAAVWWPGRVPDSSPLECDASNSLAALSAATFPNVPQRSRIRQGLLAAFTRERRPEGLEPTKPTTNSTPSFVSRNAALESLTLDQVCSVRLVPRVPPSPPRGSEQQVAKNAPQQDGAKHMAPKWKPTSDHFMSNKTQRDATRHNTTPHPDTLLRLRGGISTQGKGGGKPLLLGSARKEERAKERKEGKGKGNT